MKILKSTLTNFVNLQVPSTVRPSQVHCRSERRSVLGYVWYGHIPDDVQIGHHGEERELAGIQKGKYSRKYDKDLQNIAPDHAEKEVIGLTVVLALNRALEGISGNESAKFGRRTTVRIRGSHPGTKRIGWFAKIAERNQEEH